MKEKILFSVLFIFFAGHLYSQIAPPPPIPSKDSSVSKDTLAFVEHMPEFPGGQEAMLKFISSNLKYPNHAKDNGIEGKVIVRFIVNKEGNVEDVKVVNTVDSLLAAEAIRVVKSMPQWKPGMQLGKPVNVIFNLPINFKLEDTSWFKKKKKNKN